MEEILNTDILLFTFPRPTGTRAFQASCERWLQIADVQGKSKSWLVVVGQCQNYVTVQLISLKNIV